MAKVSDGDGVDGDDIGIVVPDGIVMILGESDEFTHWFSLQRILTGLAIDFNNFGFNAFYDGGGGLMTGFYSPGWLSVKWTQVP